MTHFQPIYGLMAEFDSADHVVEAARRVREEGYRRFDAFTPFPVEGLAQACGFPTPRIPLMVLIGGIIGGLSGFFMQYYANVVSYPLIIAGRPLNSWPAWIPITFELTVLGASFAAVFGMLALNGLPKPYHPVFNVANFQLASKDRFFVVVESTDPKFNATDTRALLESLHPLSVAEVRP